MQVNQIETDLYLLIGESYQANSTAFISGDEVLLVDAMGSRPDAEERLQAAIATAPQDPRVYKALSTVQLRRGNAKAAEASLIQTIKLDPAATDIRPFAIHR